MANPITEAADKLGKMISDSPQAAALRTARQDLDQHADVLDLLKRYQEQAGRIQKLEEDNKPIEVEDKRQLQDLHGSLIGNEVFKKFTMAQMEYVDLMRQVTASLRRQLAETEK